MGRFLAGGLAVLAVGCSSPASVNTDPIPPATTDSTPATSATTTAPPVAESTTPTTAPATTTPPTTEADTTEADIREAVDEYMAIISFNYTTGLPRNPPPEQLDRWLTGAQLDRLSDAFETEVAVGRYWEGDLDYTVIEVITSESSATVAACVRDTSVGYESNGTTFDSDEFFSTVSIKLVEVDGMWKTENVTDSGASCAL